MPALLGLGLSPVAGAPATASAPGEYTYHIDCTYDARCLEVTDSNKVFGYYVGHDEPSLLFYSNQPGSGNRSQYQLTLPKDPPPAQIPGRSWNFMLHPAFWFGMAVCANQSYPNTVKYCTPNSDSNIVDPRVSDKHPGAAYLELQFYPPGWAPLPAGDSCDARSWCVAYVQWSLATDVHGGQLNNACLAKIGGSPEYPNFAFLTHDGVPQAPANPIDATAATYTPDKTRDVFMASGDRVTVTLKDTPAGLMTQVVDATNGQTGSVTANAKFGFGQVKYAPPPSTECKNIPTTFHPMYSTSSPDTRVIWAAHSYNVAFADEIGHFDWCSQVNSGNGTCTGQEGSPAMPKDQEKADSDDLGCFSGAQSLLVRVNGCIYTNIGFDGAPYQPLWPDGNTNLHPTPIRFSSPRTGAGFTSPYQRAAFEADLPRIEFTTCNRQTGYGCTHTPTTDDGYSASFYPFFSTTGAPGACQWQIGNYIKGQTLNDYGGSDQWGPLLRLVYLDNNGEPYWLWEDFRQILSANPCP